MRTADCPAFKSHRLNFRLSITTVVEVIGAARVPITGAPSLNSSEWNVTNG